MTRHLTTCLAITALTFVSPGAAAAAPTATSSAVYDTVDAVEVLPAQSQTNYYPAITITGIISGQSAPSELIYPIYSTGSSATTDNAARCDRLALLAISKPGKYQLAMNTIYPGYPGPFNCKLIARTP